MSEVFVNETLCVITRSDMTGDIVCQWPGEDCDCLISRNPPDESYADHPLLTERVELIEEFEENALYEAAEQVKLNGIEGTREWIERKIAEVRRGDDPFDPTGESIGNLEVARDRLNEPTYNERQEKR